MWSDHLGKQVTVKSWLRGHGVRTRRIRLLTAFQWIRLNSPGLSFLRGHVVPNELRTVLVCSLWSCPPSVCSFSVRWLTCLLCLSVCRCDHQLGLSTRTFPLLVPRLTKFILSDAIFTWRFMDIHLLVSSSLAELGSIVSCLGALHSSSVIH